MPLKFGMGLPLVSVVDAETIRQRDYLDVMPFAPVVLQGIDAPQRVQTRHSRI
jgi:hypothetical protein